MHFGGSEAGDSLLRLMLNPLLLLWGAKPVPCCKKGSLPGKLQLDVARKGGAEPIPAHFFFSSFNPTLHTFCPLLSFKIPLNQQDWCVWIQSSMGGISWDL